MMTTEQFVLERFADGGVLLDLSNGAIFQLNGSGAFVWERSLAGKREDEIVTDLTAFFEVSEAVARRDVRRALDLPVGSEGPPIDLRYEEADGGYRLLAKGIPVLEISPRGPALRLLLPIEPADLTIYLRAIAPKLVTLTGTSVLHASAVARSDGRIMAFMGASGAGKTTTARMFARTGSRLICEDKLVLRLVDQTPLAVPSGEKLIREWTSTANEFLLQHGVGVWCDAHQLGGAAIGEAIPLTTLLVLDINRRKGSLMDLERLGPTAGAAAVFQHSFHGSEAPQEWRRQLNLAAAIARRAEILQSSMPDGLEALERAARLYTETTAS